MYPHMKSTYNVDPSPLADERVSTGKSMRLFHHVNFFWFHFFYAINLE